MIDLKSFYTKEQRDFVEEVREWVQTTLDPTVRKKGLRGGHVTFEEQVTWWKQLYDKGWSAPSFPEKYGGAGWDPVKQNLFIDTVAEEGAPMLNIWVQKMIGPVIMHFGTEPQKVRYMVPMLSTEDIWAQGFSEPGSGSDLASLKTRAEDKGDHWLVNGQKIWTTNAHHANRLFVLVRTDPDAKPQMGISMLLIDKDTPGIEVRPIITIDRQHEVNEVFFDDVVVPKENLLGEVNRGWDVGKFLLASERSGIAQTGNLIKHLNVVKHAAQVTPSGFGNMSLAQSSGLAKEIAEIESEIMGLRVSNMKLLQSEKIGPEVSLLKLRSSQLNQRLHKLALKTAGPTALAYDTHALDLSEEYPFIGTDTSTYLASNYFHARVSTIVGGTSEVQHNILAKAVLGL